MNRRFGELALAGACWLAAVGVIDVPAGHAADLAVKAPAPRVAAAYNWTGCYAGGFVGWGSANDWKTTDLNGYNASSASPWSFSPGAEATGGGTLGCNWQANSWLVLGLEGEGGYLKIQGSAAPNFSSVGDVATTGTGYGLIAGRVGVAFDRLLVYSKVGVAFYDTSATVTDANAPGFVATGSKSQTPFAVGVGGEYAIYDHWSGKAEYVYFDRGSAFNACGGGFCWKQDPSPIHTFKIGLNYKFW